MNTGIENNPDKQNISKIYLDNHILEGKIIDILINSIIGIYNIGNTCFINSVIQILIHCQIFMESFYSKKIAYDNNISNFIYLFKLNHPIFGNLQNHAQEFCRILLEDLSKKLNEVKEKLLYKELDYNINSSKKSKQIFHINFCGRENSIISNIFYSQIMNIFIYECK